MANKSMQSTAIHCNRKMTCKELQALRYTFNQAFQLELADGSMLQADTVVRLIPKRRMVVFGTWKEKPVVAKLFFDNKHAQRHFAKEQAGVKVLQDNKVPTPALLHTGQSKDKRIQILLFEQIFNAVTLDEIWRDKFNVQSVLPQLQSVVIELATQHVLGIAQHDLHLKNFLITEKVIYTLDGGQIEHSPQLLSKKVSMDNLALFLSQLGVGVERYQEQLFLHYATARGWLLKEEDLHELSLLIKNYNETRWQQYQKKIFRDCTDFAAVRRWNTFGMYDRAYAGQEFMQFIQHPELAFNHATTKMLKAGRSSTVVQVTLDGKQFVIKRYNVKNIWHRLRRLLRTTRALKSWHFAQKLRLFYVGTPRPVACIEQRWLKLRGKSYFVMEHVAGISAAQWLKQHTEQTERLQGMIRRIIATLYNLARLEVTHGDLKMTNLLINASDKPLLIDFDGAAEHAALSGLRRGWRKEVKRLLQNFHDHPKLLQMFKDALRQN